MTGITATLRNAVRHDEGPWRPYDHLSGDIWDDSRGRFNDGERVSTSEIKSVDGDVFTTRNSVYRVESWRERPANDNLGARAAAVVEAEMLVEAVAETNALDYPEPSPDERPGDYLMPAASVDRYPAPAVADLVTFWTRNGKPVMSVVTAGKVVDYEVKLNVLEAGARFAIEHLMALTTGKAA